jgi:hypothetical protein
MCLDTVYDEEETKKLGLEGYGWKIFWKEDGKLSGEFYGGPYKTGKRNRAHNKFGGAPIYGAGFHVFLIKTEAKEYKRVSCGGRCFALRKVKWQSPVASGKQCWARIVVAKYMTILED